MPLVRFVHREGKDADYRLRSDRAVHEACDGLMLRLQDVLINLVKLKREKWSFGASEAPCAN